MKRIRCQSMADACNKAVALAVKEILADPTEAAVLLVAGSPVLAATLADANDRIREAVRAAGQVILDDSDRAWRTGDARVEADASCDVAGVTDSMAGRSLSLVILFHPDFEVCTEAERVLFEDWFGVNVLTRIRSCPLGAAAMYVPGGC
jgi:hypothetical protein